MTATLQLIGLLVIGYLSSHLLAARLPGRFQVMTGLGFVVLGVLAGPHVTGALDRGSLSLMEPVLSVGLGAVGLRIGLRFRFQRLLAQHGHALQLAFFTVVACVLLVGGTAVLIVGSLFHPSQWPEALPAALALGTVAAAAAPATVASARQLLDGGGRLGSLLQTAANLAQVLALCLFGLVFCAFHVGAPEGIRPPTIVEWMVVNLAVGILLGVLFFLFLGRESDNDRLQLALIGIVLFASGIAHYLHLSPLFTNVVLGIMLGNTSKRADALSHVLRTIEAPVVLVILMVAGASWRITALGQPVVWGFVLALIVLRPIALTLGGWGTYRYSEQDPHLTPFVGQGLVGQGSLGIAMAVDFMIVYEGLATDALLSAAIVSALLWSTIAPTWIRAAIRDADPSLVEPVPVSGDPEGARA